MSSSSMPQHCPAIVVVAFDRIHTLQRLLASLCRADYPASASVLLVISVDGSDTPDVASFAQRFDWPFGRKEVVIHRQHLGLREHVLRCGDMTSRFGSIVMLEDDVTVAPAFYRYAMQSLDFYAADDRVAGISLYTFEVHPYGFEWRLGLSFEPLHDGFDNWFALLPSSWGQCWTARQWNSFRDWLRRRGERPAASELPDRVRAWPPSSWKKLFNDYQVETRRWFVFPRVALSTNWGDAGTHFRANTARYQTALQFRGVTWRFSRPQESLARYDAHLELEPECVRAAGALTEFDFAMDVFALKQATAVHAPYVLTIRDARPALRSFGSSLRPIELNVLAGEPGAGLRLVTRKSWLESLDRPLSVAARSSILARASDRISQAAIIERERRRRAERKGAERQAHWIARTARIPILPQLFRLVEAWRVNRRAQRRLG